MGAARKNCQRQPDKTAPPRGPAPWRRKSMGYRRAPATACRSATPRSPPPRGRQRQQQAKAHQAPIALVLRLPRVAALPARPGLPPGSRPARSPRSQGTADGVQAGGQHRPDDQKPDRVPATNQKRLYPSDRMAAPSKASTSPWARLNRARAQCRATPGPGHASGRSRPMVRTWGRTSGEAGRFRRLWGHGTRLGNDRRSHCTHSYPWHTAAQGALMNNWHKNKSIL